MAASVVVPAVVRRPAEGWLTVGVISSRNTLCSLAFVAVTKHAGSHGGNRRGEVDLLDRVSVR